MVKVVFNEHELLNPVFKNVHMDRNPSGMSHCWGIIQAAYNKWHGIQQESMDRQESGTNIEDLVSHASLLTGLALCIISIMLSSAHFLVYMLKMFKTYREDNVEFKFIHVFKRIKKCPSGTR
jgi:hypothetical protein